MDYFEKIEVQRGYYCIGETLTHIPFLSSSTISTRIQKYKETAINQIIERLSFPSNKNALVGIQTDGWSAAYTRAGYFSVIAHWISNEMKWQEALLAFTPTAAKHKGVELADLLTNCFERFSIQNRVSTITTDNASNNNRMIESMNEELVLRPRQNTDSFLLIPCLSHIIQLAQGVLLDALDCKPTNEEIVRNWDDEEETEILKKRRSIRLKSVRSKDPKRVRGPEYYGDIPWTLYKVSL